MRAMEFSWSTRRLRSAKKAALGVSTNFRTTHCQAVSVLRSGARRFARRWQTLAEKIIQIKSYILIDLFVNLQ